MLTVAKMGGGRSNYYLALAAEYYYNGQAVSREGLNAVWLGKGAARLGLNGNRVSAAAFKKLFDGFSPDGQKKLVQNAGRYNKEKSERNRMPGYDLTFSAPKSFSYAWALATPWTQADLERIQREAVEETIARIEQYEATVRFGRGGKIKERAELIVMAVQHGTARQVDADTMPDMDVHTHACLINTGFGEQSGKSGALNGLEYLDENKDFAKDQGAFYRTALARRVESLGFRIRWTDKTQSFFELVGIPESELQRCSKRSAQIEAQAPKATHSYQEQKRVNVRKRVAKRELDPTDIFTHWHDEARQHGITYETIEALRQRPAEPAAQQRFDLTRETLPRGPLATTPERATLAAQTLAVPYVAEPTPAPPQANAQAQGKTSPAEQRDVAKAVKRIEQAAERATVADTPNTLRQAEQGTPKAAKPPSARQAEQAEQEQKLTVLRLAARAYQKQGFKVVAVSYDRKEVAALQKAGFIAAHVSTYLRDNETPAEKWKRLNTRPKRTLKEVITFQNNFTPLGRKLYAEYKHVKGDWSSKTKQKYAGEYHKPTNRFAHEFKYATGQISKKQRDYLNTELGKKDRKLTENTIVVNLSGRGKAMEKLAEYAEAKGARMMQRAAFLQAVQAPPETRAAVYEKIETATQMQQQQQQQRQRR